MIRDSSIYRCGGCRLDFPADSFNKDKSRKSGLDRLCKACKKQSYQQNREARCAKVRENYVKNADREKERARLWRKENREDYLRYMRDYRSRNLEERRAADREYAEKTREQKRVSDRARYIENKDAYLLRSATRRATQLQRTPKCLTESDMSAIRETYDHADYMSREVGIKYHVDHIIPLRGGTVSGLHVPWNLRVIPAKENLAKGNRVTETLLRETESFHMLRAARGVAIEIAGHDQFEETDLP